MSNYQVLLTFDSCLVCDLKKKKKKTGSNLPSLVVLKSDFRKFNSVTTNRYWWYIKFRTCIDLLIDVRFPWAVVACYLSTNNSLFVAFDILGNSFYYNGKCGEYFAWLTQWTSTGIYTIVASVKPYFRPKYVVFSACYQARLLHVTASLYCTKIRFGSDLLKTFNTEHCLKVSISDIIFCWWAGQKINGTFVRCLYSLHVVPHRCQENFSEWASMVRFGGLTVWEGKRVKNRAGYGGGPWKTQALSL